MSCFIEAFRDINQIQLNLDMMTISKRSVWSIQKLTLLKLQIHRFFRQLFLYRLSEHWLVQNISNLVLSTTAVHFINCLLHLIYVNLLLIMGIKCKKYSRKQFQKIKILSKLNEYTCRQNFYKCHSKRNLKNL